MPGIEEFRKLAGLVARPGLNESQFEKIRIADLPDKLKKAIRAYSKAREAYIDTHESAVVATSRDAPEFDEHDGSFYRLINLRTGQETNPREGMKVFGPDKQISLGDDEVLLAGDRYSKNWVNLTVNAAMREKLRSPKGTPT